MNTAEVMGHRQRDPHGGTKKSYFQHTRKSRVQTDWFIKCPDGPVALTLPSPHGSKHFDLLISCNYVFCLSLLLRK